MADLSIKIELKWTCLKDNPELKEKIKHIKSRIDEVLENDYMRHLSNTSLVLRYIASDLEQISKEGFELHNVQKIKNT